MLVSLKNILPEAAISSYAVAGFNVFGFEDAFTVVKVAEAINKPVILLCNKDCVNHMPVEIIGPMLRQIGNQTKVPVCVHLDHCSDEKLILRAAKSGFTSVMFDGSHLPIDENIAKTKTVVRMMKEFNVSVEGEVGSIPYADSKQLRIELTDPDELSLFTQETMVDAVAVSIGNIHRQEEKKAVINFDLLETISAKVVTPLVIHGTSGIQDEDLKNLSVSQVAKFNIGTCLRQAFGETLRKAMNEHPEKFDRLYFYKKAMLACESVVEEKMRLLSK
ncbi:MAG: class II fructose-bisphosphate aldolase [Oligoflexales bacterium]